MVTLNRIYTRTGDAGSTGLVGGARVSKSDLRVEAYGAVDETNAAIGMARLTTRDDATLDPILARITYLHGRLRIAPGQEPLWAAVAQAMRDNAAAVAPLLRERLENAQKDTAVDALDSYERLGEAQIDGLKKFVDAFTALYAGLSPDQKTLYTAEYSEAAYSVDVAKREVEETIALGTLPSDMVPDGADHLLYVGVPAGIDVVDVATGAIAGTITGVGAPLNLAFDPTTRACFAATNTGLWRIDPQTFTTTQLFASASFSVRGVSAVY